MTSLAHGETTMEYAAYADVSRLENAMNTPANNQCHSRSPETNERCRRPEDHDGLHVGRNTRWARSNDAVTEVLQNAMDETRNIRQQEAGDGYHCIDCKRPQEFCKCRAVPMICPHCHKPLDHAELRRALNKELASRPRPKSVGNRRNPAGRPKKEKRDGSVHCAKQSPRSDLRQD